MARTEEEYRTLFENDPTHLDAFASLRRIYRQSERFQELAWLFEKRAQAMDDPAKGSELYRRAADIRFQHLNDEQGGIDDLMQALRGDPGQRRVVAQLKTKLKEASRWEEYLEVQEKELAMLAAVPGEERRAAALHLEIGTLLEEHFSRMDQAMYHYQQAVRADSRNVDALSSARRLYKNMGEWPMVAKLLDAEARATPQPRKRIELLFELGQVQAQRLHDLAGASRTLQDVLAGRPGHIRAMETLAEVYSSADWGQPDGLGQASRLFFQVAQQLRSEDKAEEALTFLRRAVNCDPENRQAVAMLEEIYEALGKYEELERSLRQRIQRAQGPEIIDLTMRRAHVLEEYLKNREQAKLCYEEVLAHQPPGGAAAAFLSELYVEDEEWDKLAALRERELESIDDEGVRVEKMMELASLYRDRLDNEDKAAIFLHAILEIQPNHPVALEYYQQHFRKKEDYRGLADLLVFAFEGALQSSGDMETALAKMEELAEISERRLGDLDRAMDAWQRVMEIMPSHPKAQDHVRRLQRKQRMWQSLLQALERDVGAARTPEERVQALLRMAQAYWDKRMDPLRNIEILNEVLRYAPTNLTAMKALMELYKREGDHQGLADIIKMQMEHVTNRVERVNLLRKLSEISYKELHNLRDAGWACTQILDLVPGDEESIARLCFVLEEMEDWPKLIKTLRYHAKAVAVPEERVKILRRMAKLATEKVKDEVLAAEAWERIMENAPQDEEALSALTGLYEKLGRWEELADVLERRAKALAADEEAYNTYMRRLARVADTRLKDPDRAVEAWRAVSEMMPSDQEALGALARLYYEQEDWAGLADVLRQQIPLSEDPKKAVGLSLRLADIMDQYLDQPDEAIDVLEKTISSDESAAPNPEAMARLRRLYVSVGEPAKAVKLAEREMMLTEPGPEKTRLGLEVAAAWRDEVGDDEEAIKAYERVLEEDPASREALSALVVLYTRTGRWEKLIETNQVLFDFADNDRERLRLLFQIAEVYEERLEKPETAFNWYRKAFELYPHDRGTLTSLERSAAENSLWEELIEVYEELRARAQHPAQHLEAASKIAQVCEKELSDPGRSFDVLRQALIVDLTGTELLPELERLGEELDRWDDLVEIYERVLKHVRTDELKIRIFHKCAAVLEDRLDDRKGALGRIRRAFELDAQDLTTSDWMVRLAEETESWDDLLAVHAARYTSAQSLDERIELIRQSARVVEQKVGDKVKAFRAYLHGFLIDPEDDEILAEIWRLAGEIGEYSEKTLAADLKERERVVVESAAAEARHRRMAARKDRAARKLRPSALRPISGSGGEFAVSAHPGLPDSTQELDLEDLEILDDEAAEAKASARRLDPTGELQLSDIIEISVVRTGEIPLLEGSQEFQLLEMVEGSAEVARSLALSEDSEPQDIMSVAGLSLPQPRTAWEEFARAYAMLPAPDLETRRRHCHAIARIWRDGAKQLVKAFEALQIALEMDVMHEATRTMMEEVAREASMLEELAEVYLNILEQIHGIDAVVFLNAEVGRLMEEVGQMDRAEQHYKNILSIKPDYKPAFDQLQEIYRKQERWEDLAALDERQMEDLMDQLPAGPEREEKLRELATLYEEKLDQPYEAMEVLSKLLASKADDLSAYRGLARLCQKTGSWAKAVEALSKVEEMAEDEEEVLLCRRRMAEIYKDELELPDRAIELFQKILNLQPEDYQSLAALDELYEAHERYEDLEKVLEVRGRLIEDPVFWEELMVRRARNLEKNLQQPENAAEIFEELRGANPSEEKYAEESIRLLREAGKVNEAIAVLAERIDAALRDGAPVGEVAALMVRQSVLISQDQGDVEQARLLLNRALEILPEYPSALGELARLHKNEEDWPAYAEARMREAEATTDDTRGANALFEAGQVYRDKLNDPEKARTCFEQSLSRDSLHLDAMAALSGLAAQKGEWGQAIELMERQTQMVEDPIRKASLTTEMGLMYLKGMEDPEKAKVYLEQAMDWNPEHVPAVIALADIYYEEERWEEAKRLLEEALNRLTDQPALAARLGYRLGGLYRDMGDPEEAFRVLKEVDRKNPNQVLLKLAVGENRYEVHRWREAAKILGALVEHPDAERYPDEVARAACLAAEAEIKQRRPGKAPPLWEAALKLKPDCMDAINALVKYHTDRGALDDAARYLKAQAGVTSDSDTRVQLFDSLGDLYHDKLDDHKEALRAYMEALEAAEPIERRHLSILEKVFPLCRALGEDEEAARIIGFILAFTEDPELRAAREIQAADAFVALGDNGRAIEHLERALELDPLSESAVLMLTDVYEQELNYRPAADMLSAYVARLDEATDQAEWSRRAALFERLAHIYQHGLEDPRSATEVLEKALGMDPTRLSSRVALCELYGEAPQYEEKAFYNHLALVADDVRRYRSLHHLGRIYQRRGEIDKALGVYRVLEVLNRADLDELGFIAQHSPPEPGPEERWPGSLSDEDRIGLLAHPDTIVMGEVFATIWEGAPALFGGGLERFGLSAKDRVSPVADMDIAKVYSGAARTLGNRLTGLYISWDSKYEGVNIACHAPPIVVVGPEVDAMPLPELRFRLGRALELTRPEYILAAGLDAQEFTSLFAAVLRAFHPRHSRRKLEQGDPISARAQQLKKDLPYRVSRKLVDLLQKKAHVEFNSALWRQAIQKSGNRAGLLVSGNLKASMQVVMSEDLPQPPSASPGPEEVEGNIEQSEQLKDLLSFAVSEDYFLARKRMGQVVGAEEAEGGEEEA